MNFFFGKKKTTAPAASKDREVDALYTALAQRREQCAALEQELFDLQAFATEVERRFTALHQQRDEARQRLERARAEVARRARWGTRVDDGTRLPEMHDRFEQWRGQDTAANAEAAPRGTTAPLTEISEAQLKTLYRALAKRFHPDLTPDPAEKAWREKIMAQINGAYAAHDLAALQQLAQQPDHPPPPPPSVRAALIAGLQAELARLDELSERLNTEIDHWANSPAVQLMLDAKLAQRAGRNLLDEMTATLQGEIRELERELAGL